MKIKLIDMRGILKMEYQMEKEYIIVIQNLLKVIDMKAILKMVNQKEKDLCIIILIIIMNEILKNGKKKERNLLCS